MPDTLWQATAAAAKAAAAGQPPGSAGGLVDVTRECMGMMGKGGGARTQEASLSRPALCCIIGDFLRRPRCVYYAVGAGTVYYRMM